MREEEYFAAEMLVLGCGERKYPGAIHVDVLDNVGADDVLDLNRRPWPYRDGQFREVVAEDVLEHLDDLIPTMEEIHRVLATGGTLWVTTPHWQHPNSWHDPTHKHHFTEKSFDYFDPATTWGRKYHYYTHAKFRIEERGTAGGNIQLRMVKI